MGLNDIKAQHAGLACYLDDLATLQADNKVFVKGQLIIAKDILGRLGVKVGDWDVDNLMPEDLATPFNDLPWLLKPEDAGAGASNFFKVRTSNAATTNPKYEVTGGNTVITDNRFVGVSEVCIVATNMGQPFRDEDIVIDGVAGTVTINGFSGIGDNDQILVTVPAVISTAESFAAILPRIAKIERALAVAYSGQGVFLFKGTKAQIDAMPGFTVLDDTAGRTLMGYSATDPRFNTIWDITGNKGYYSVTLTADNIPKHNHQTAVDEQFTGNDHPSAIGRALSSIRAFIRFWFKTDAIGKESYELMGTDKDINDATDPKEPTIGPTSFYGKATPDPISVVQPYITLWILGYTPE